MESTKLCFPERSIFRKTSNFLDEIAPVYFHQLITNSFHNDIGNWDLEASKKIILEIFCGKPATSIYTYMLKPFIAVSLMNQCRNSEQS